MPFEDSSELAKNEVFRGRVQVAMSTAAKDIVGEVITSGDEEKHRKRHLLGHAILLSPNNYLDAFVKAVVTNQVITEASLDGDIQFTVNSVFDDLAGVLITD